MKRLMDKIEDKEISLEDIKDGVSDNLNLMFTALIDAVNKDVSLGINNDDIFYANSYLKYIVAIENYINTQFKLIIKFIPGAEFDIYIKNNELREMFLNNIKSITQTNNLSGEKELSYLTTIVPTVRGVRIKNNPLVYITVDFYSLIVKDGKDAKYFSNNVLKLVDTMIINIKETSIILKDTDSILADIKNGDSLDKLYVKYLNGDINKMNNASEIKKAVLFVNGMFNKYITTSGVDTEDKISILVRMQYLLVFINVIVIIFIALANPILLYTSIALVIYSIFLYLYKLANKIITGNKDPFNTGINALFSNKFVEKKDASIAEIDDNLLSHIKFIVTRNQHVYQKMAEVIKANVKQTLDDIAEYITGLIKGGK